MGFVVSEKDLFKYSLDTLMKPIIYCNPDIETKRIAISINAMMAERLISVKESRRAMQMENCLSEVIRTLPDGAVIQDFDAMFNPKYEIDVIHILIAASKVKLFEVIRPGRYENNKLGYC